MERSIERRKQESANQRAVKAKGGAAVNRVIILSSKPPAHHTGGTYPEQVVYCVERKENRSGQRDRRILDGVAQHSHKVGVRKIIDNHNQRADDGWDCQLHDRLRDGDFFKQFCFPGVFHFVFLRSIKQISIFHRILWRLLFEYFHILL